VFLQLWAHLANQCGLTNTWEVKLKQSKSNYQKSCG